MCMCSDDNTCYTFADFPGTYFNSYCGPDGCHLRAYLGNDVINVATNETITTSTQMDANGDYLPLSDPAYMKINRISCFGCPVKKSC